VAERENTIWTMGQKVQEAREMRTGVYLSLLEWEK